MRLDTVNLKLRLKLIEVARAGDVVTYGELMRACGLPDRFVLSHDLGVIADDCVERGEPLLVAVGVLADTSAPSGGFYEKAEDLGVFLDGNSEDARLKWWLNYLKHVHAYWKNHDA
jgi:hypothetical protein